MLTANEIYYILDLLADKFGPGYSDVVVADANAATTGTCTIDIGRFQAKLSIMLGAAIGNDHA